MNSSSSLFGLAGMMQNNVLYSSETHQAFIEQLNYSTEQYQKAFGQLGIEPLTIHQEGIAPYLNDYFSKLTSIEYENAFKRIGFNPFAPDSYEGNFEQMTPHVNRYFSKMDRAELQQRLLTRPKRGNIPSPLMDNANYTGSFKDDLMSERTIECHTLAWKKVFEGQTEVELQPALEQYNHKSLSDRREFYYRRKLRPGEARAIADAARETPALQKINLVNFRIAFSEFETLKSSQKEVEGRKSLFEMTKRAAYIREATSFVLGAAGKAAGIALLILFIMPVMPGVLGLLVGIGVVTGMTLLGIGIPAGIYCKMRNSHTKKLYNPPAVAQIDG